MRPAARATSMPRWMECDPSRAGVGDDDACGAEDGEPAEDAEARVPGLLSECLAARDRDLDHHVAAAVMLARHLGDGLAHHLAGLGVDGGLAGRKRKARLGHGPDTLARAKDNPAARGPFPHRRQHEGTVRHVGIVARILDDAGAREAGPQLLARKCEGGPLAAWQGDRDRIGEAAGQECRIGGLGGRGGTCPRGPAAAQGVALSRGHGALIDRADPALLAAPPPRPLWSQP